MHTDDRRTVSGCFLFADHGLTEAAEAILDRCPIRSYRKGELIYSRDCFERAVGVLLSGEAEVLKGRGVVLNTLSAGDSFGVAGLFTENDRYVSDIRAVRPCRVLLLSAPALEQLFAADNAAALGYYPVFVRAHSAFLNQKLDAFSSSSAEGRICGAAAGKYGRLPGGDSPGLFPISAVPWALAGLRSTGVWTVWKPRALCGARSGRSRSCVRSYCRAASADHRFNPCILRVYPVKDIFKKSAKE